MSSLLTVVPTAIHIPSADPTTTPINVPLVKVNIESIDILLIYSLKEFQL